MRPFLIDTDAGSDDAVALIMALRSPEISVEAITVVAGNVPLEQGVQNVLYVCELCEAEVPVFAGRDRPLKRPLRTAQFVHGEDGLGDIGLPLRGRTPNDGDGVEAMLECVERFAGEITVVTLGPLTNLALALDREPMLAQKIHSCVVMGGTGLRPGNVTPTAEFNIWVDPEAAQRVLQAELALMLVGWDISIAHAVFDREQAARLRSIGGPFAEFSIDIQEVLEKFSIKAMGIEGFDLPDAIAMAIAIDRSLILRSERLNVMVETESELCLGQTVIDVHHVTGRASNAEIVLEASRSAFLRQLKAALSP